MSLARAALLALVALLAAAATAAAAGHPRLAGVQRPSVSWRSDPGGHDRAGFLLPGIGRGVVVCSRDTQWVRVFPADPREEVTMWLYREQIDLVTGIRTPPTIRTARHAPWTGADFNEGFNQYRGQRATRGEFTGIVSSRGRWDLAGGPGPPPVSLRFAFEWDFRRDAPVYCRVRGRVVSGRSGYGGRGTTLSLNWRGEQNAPGRDHATARLAGIGTLEAICDAADQRLALVPEAAPAAVRSVTSYEGSDTFTGPPADAPFAIGPDSRDGSLPPNGIVVARLVSIAGPVTLIASSEFKLNDSDPSRNFCFVAAQALRANRERAPKLSQGS